MILNFDPLILFVKSFDNKNIILVHLLHDELIITPPVNPFIIVLKYPNMVLTSPTFLVPFLMPYIFAFFTSTYQ